MTPEEERRADRQWRLTCIALYGVAFALAGVSWAIIALIEGRL